MGVNTMQEFLELALFAALAGLLLAAFDAYIMPRI
jgi:hypothetical protein